MRMATLFALVLLAACARGEPGTDEDRAAAQTKRPAALRPPDRPKPAAATEPTLVEKRDIVTDGEKGCAFIVRYVGAIDQPATWEGEPCAAVTAMFLDTPKLQSLGKYARMSAGVHEDIARTEGRVFYVEGQFSAAVYPLNGAGVVYRVFVAD